MRSIVILAILALLPIGAIARPICLENIGYDSRGVLVQTIPLQGKLHGTSFIIPWENRAALNDISMAFHGNILPTVRDRRGQWPAAGIVAISLDTSGEFPQASGPPLPKVNYVTYEPQYQRACMLQWHKETDL